MPYNLNNRGAFPQSKIVIPFAKNKFINLTRRHHKFLCLQRATIAEWLRTPTNSPADRLPGKQVNEVNLPEGGASEDQKFVAKPTQSNMTLFFANGIITEGKGWG